MLPTHSILDLHRTITAIRSVSGGEGLLADYMENLLLRHEVAVARQGNSLLATMGEGPMLLFGTHLDTVSPVPGWSRDPWRVEVVDGRVYGLGSNDAKAAVAAMTVAFLAFTEAELPLILGLALVECGETTGAGKAALLADLKWKGLWPAMVVMGKPTGLDLIVAQKSLRVPERRAPGGVCAGNPAGSAAARRFQRTGHGHAAPPGTDGSGSLCAVPVSPGPGRRGPESCVASTVIAAALAARPQTRLLGSAALDDMKFMSGIPAVKCGPGASERSHAPDEYVEEAEVLDGARFYARLVRTWAERTLGSTAAEETYAHKY